MKRSGKFWRKNERDIMERLGLEPTPNSGSGWLVKEDGQSEDIICQLKSTDAESISFKRADFGTLAHNAFVAHKLPLFALQFVQQGELYLVVRPEELQMIAAAMAGEKVKQQEVESIDLNMQAVADVVRKKTIGSGASARTKFLREQEEAKDKTKYIK